MGGLGRVDNGGMWNVKSMARGEMWACGNCGEYTVLEVQGVLDVCDVYKMWKSMITRTVRHTTWAGLTIHAKL